MTTREEVAAALNGVEPDTRAKLQEMLDKGVDPEMVNDAAKANSTGVPSNYGPVGAWAGVPIVVDKNLPRKALDAVSGGVTEAVGKAVEGAPAQAAMENKPGVTQGSVPPEEWARLQAEANPTIPGAAGGLAQEHSSQSSRAVSGKDPRAVAEAKAGEAQADEYAKAGYGSQLEADRSQYDKLQQVQQNEMEAIQAFKAEQDATQTRYADERQKQMDRMQSIQKAMDSVPQAPRTIHQWLEKSGTGDKIRFGLAAAFSVLGGAMKGDDSAQRFINNVKSNIDANVQKEAENYALLGKRYGMADSVYGHLRQNLHDDNEALNLTKAMYYDAAINATKQIALQYKMDLQSPQVMQFLEHLQREKDALTLRTAQDIQSQTASGVKEAPVKGTGTKDFEEQINKFGEQYEKIGGRDTETRIGALTRAQRLMRESGMDKDENFLKAIQAIAQVDSPARQAALLAEMRFADPKELEALQLLISATNTQIKDEAGKTVTKNELGRQLAASGGFSQRSIENLIKMAQGEREGMLNSLAGTYGGPGNVVGKAYSARKRMADLEGEHRGIAAMPRIPIDQSDVRNAPR